MLITTFSSFRYQIDLSLPFGFGKGRRSRIEAIFSRAHSGVPTPALFCNFPVMSCSVLFAQNRTEHCLFTILAINVPFSALLERFTNLVSSLKLGRPCPTSKEEWRGERDMTSNHRGRDCTESVFTRVLSIIALGIDNIVAKLLARFLTSDHYGGARRHGNVDDRRLSRATVALHKNMCFWRIHWQIPPGTTPNVQLRSNTIGCNTRLNVFAELGSGDFVFQPRQSPWHQEELHRRSSGMGPMVVYRFLTCNFSSIYFLKLSSLHSGAFEW